MLIDTHCHLFAEPLGADASAVVARAVAAGVARLVVPAFDRASWASIERLAREHPAVVGPALGLHPWQVTEGLDPLDRVELGRRLDAASAVAVGEIGLDHAVARGPAARARQAEALAVQLELARERRLPVILHCRQAFDTLFALLEAHGPLAGVVHGFARGAELAERLVAAGLHVAFGGVVTRLGARRARAAVAAVPAGRLLLETDAPAVGIAGLAPERVEPADLPRIAAVVAELRGVSVAEVAARSTDNARALFFGGEGR